MKLKTLSFYRSFFFVLLSSLGFFYLGFLFLLTPKVFSGFLMQLIFLTDGLHSHSLALLLQPDFYFQILIGALWSYLLLNIIKTFHHTLIKVFKTKKFVQSLDVTRNTNQYIVFKTNTPQVFTVGFIHPQIFLSQKLLDISTPAEISSVLLHEQSHVLNHDPLKNLIIDFVNQLTPYFPLKSWLFGQYLTLIEISCDQFSQTHFAHPTSLVSALLKVKQFSSPQFATGFSAQSERIKILVGKKTLPFRSTVLASLTVFALMVMVSSSLYKTNIFYECDHLLKCFENLITPDHITLKTNCLTSSE